MNREQLEKYTQKAQLHGLNSQQVLKAFMEYQKIVKDPLLVFRYMEEKAICIFLTQFWLQKGKVHAELGDYATAFECVVLARSRTQDNDSHNNMLIDKCEKQMRSQMLNDMRKSPTTSKARRSIVQHGSNLMDDSFINNGSKQSEMIKLYDQKYQACRQQRQRRTQIKWSQLPHSWMHESYEMEDAVEEKIEKQIFENSIKLSRNIRHHSMHTPLPNRDPMKLKNTKNSVELARMKKETREKMKKNGKLKEDYPDSDMDNNFIEDESRSMNVNSLPVGKHFEKRKQRRVTFSNVLLKAEKIRSVEWQLSSLCKTTRSIDDKMDVEDYESPNA